MLGKLHRTLRAKGQELAIHFLPAFAIHVLASILYDHDSCQEQRADIIRVQHQLSDLRGFTQQKTFLGIGSRVGTQLCMRAKPQSSFDTHSHGSQYFI